MNRFYLLLFVLFSVVANGQELECEIVVNAQQTGDANNPVFQTLENALREFVNQTNWTDLDLQPHERINCSMFLNITGFDSNSFSGSIQVRASRPVYGSSMITPIFNYRDENFSFDYTEYESLDFNANEYTSNLVSVVGFYVYTILGLDADTFEELGGTAYFEEASRIVGAAQQGGEAGWSANNGRRSRYSLNADLLSNAFRDYRLARYTYHREGLDLMHRSPRQGKEGVRTAILGLGAMNSRRHNSLLMRTFFDAKAGEIEQIFSGGPTVSIREVVDVLNSVAPTFADQWANISY